MTELIRILGDNALLLPCRARTKKPEGKWGRLRIEEMRKPGYLRKLASAGNIGVALGITSAGLVSIDIDDDGFATTFLELNPALRNTFRTRGNRGCNFWLQMLGSYPAKTSLKLDGKAWGEFRSHDHQTIAYGTHKDTGKPYQWLTRHKALICTFDSIMWPPGIEGFQKTPKEYQLKEFRNGHDGQDGNEGYDGNDVVSVSRVCVSPPPSGGLTLEYVISVATLTRVHQTHSAHWNLARGVKGLEQQEGGLMSLTRLRSTFDAWRATVRPEFLTNDAEDDFMEFLSCYADVKYPLGTRETLHEAFEQARTNPLPPECGMTQCPKRKLLIALCYELQKIAGDEPFFLSVIDAGKLFDTPWETIRNWFNAFTVMGILQVVQKANRAKRRSTRFRYINKPKTKP